MGLSPTRDGARRGITPVDHQVDQHPSGARPMRTTILSRRRFLRHVGLGGAVAALTAASWSRVYGANEKLRLASVGVGGKGWSDLTGVAASPHVEVVALCDIDDTEKHMGRAAEKFPAAKRFTDWRRLLDKPKEFDAVIVSTPDHMHAPIALPAMAAGQARLLPEAADAHRPRGPADAAGREEARRRHADGQPDPVARGVPHGGEARPRRRHREGEGGPLLAVRRRCGG